MEEFPPPPPQALNERTTKKIRQALAEKRNLAVVRKQGFLCNFGSHEFIFEEDYIISG
jgi:hypothetical protein